MLHVTLTSHSYGGFKLRVQPGDYFSVWVGGQRLDLDCAVLIDLVRDRLRSAQMIGAMLESRLHEQWTGERRPLPRAPVLEAHELPEGLPPPLRPSLKRPPRVLDKQEQARRKERRLTRAAPPRSGRGR